jgi:protein-tyrosine phosphatase
MIDLHCHLLPGVDDGPWRLEESVAMCRLAESEGTRVLVATPHQRHPSWWNEDRAKLLALVAELQERLGEWPRVLPGAEIRADAELVAAVDELPGGSLLPLAGSRYLLVELNRQAPTVDPAELVHELTVAGWHPILAHPEHYPWLLAQPELIERLIAQGALLQITGASLTGYFGRRPQLACRNLLDAGWVHFVASDAHGIDRRPPGLQAAFAALAHGWGEETAQALTSGNPAAVIENRPLPRFSLLRPAYA